MLGLPLALEHTIHLHHRRRASLRTVYLSSIVIYRLLRQKVRMLLANVRCILLQRQPQISQLLRNIVTLVHQRDVWKVHIV